MSLAHVVRGLGFRTTVEPNKAHALEIVHNKHPVMVAVRTVNGDERLSSQLWSDAVVQVMLRVDLEAFKRLGLETGREVDVWLGTIESSLGALVARFEGYDPPFPGHVLRVQRLTPGDAWALHFVTVKERFRDSRWLVCKGG